MRSIKIQAKILGVPEEQVHTSVLRLLRLNLVEVVANTPRGSNSRTSLRLYSLKSGDWSSFVEQLSTKVDSILGGSEL